MDFIERLQRLAKKISSVSGNLKTAEATKNVLVIPFLHDVLGYDAFDSSEVIPEFTADVVTKKGEKVDYALMKEGKVQILIECKKSMDKLSIKNAEQLLRYFPITDARIAILTNGSQYKFYTDLDTPNKMDEKPFLVLDMEDIDERIIPEVKKLNKENFDVDSVVGAAGEMKYLSEIKTFLAEQFSNPNEDFIKFFASHVYDGVVSDKVNDVFMDIAPKAFEQFLDDSVNARLKSVIGASPSMSKVAKEGSKAGVVEQCLKIFTTEEELEGFNIVRDILRQKLNVRRVVARDTQSYFGVLLDDNDRKPLCRLYFNAKQKYLGVIGANNEENRIPIDVVEDIFKHAEVLLSTVDFYETSVEEVIA